MKKLLGFLTAIVILMGILVFSIIVEERKAVPLTNAEKPLIKIGVVLPLSDNNAVIGTQLKKGDAENFKPN